jgi:hypothetical protein
VGSNPTLGNQPPNKSFTINKQETIMDVKCVVCGEPWDYYGINHGDMEKWEAELFKKGSGCPCCEGETEHPFEPQTIFDIGYGDKDPILRLQTWEDNQEGRTPKWEEPKPELLWECSGCGVQVERDANGELDYNIPMGATCRQWYISHPFWKGEPTEEPAHTFKGAGEDYDVCEFCLSNCENCGKEVCSNLDYSDVYDEGWCTTLESYGYQEVFCIDCVETTCSECNSLPEDCECHIVHCDNCHDVIEGLERTYEERDKEFYCEECVKELLKESD